jgi:hypothetical protein
MLDIDSGPNITGAVILWLQLRREEEEEEELYTHQSSSGSTFKLVVGQPN